MSENKKLEIYYMQNRVSLVIPIYNEADTIEQLLISINKQSLRPFELIFVDAGSTDGTIEIIENQIFPFQVKLIKEKRCYPGKGRNIGAENATGDVIVFADAGFVFREDWLECLIKGLVGDVCFGNWQVYLYKQTAFHKACCLIYMDPIVKRNGSEAREESVASMAIRKDAWNSMEKFAEEYRCGEDVLFLEKILHSDLKIDYAMDAESYWFPPSNIWDVWKKQVSYSRWREYLQFDDFEFWKSIFLLGVYITFTNLVSILFSTGLVIVYFIINLYRKKRSIHLRESYVSIIPSYIVLSSVVFLANLVGRGKGKMQRLIADLKILKFKLSVFRDNLKRGKYSFTMRKINKIVCSQVENPINRPQAVLIETTSKCNAKCVMCPQPDLGRKHEVMSRELYQKIIDECVELGVDMVQLNGTNEPLLDPYLLDRIHYAKERGINKLYCYTNCSLLNEKMAQDILESPLDMLIISFDALVEEYYLKMRKGLDFNKVKNNTLYILNEKARLGKKLHIVIASTLYNKRNAEMVFGSELYKKLKCLADDVDIMFPGELHNWAGQISFEGISYENHSKKYQVPCLRLWSRMSILSNGNVSLCCLDYKGQISPGNLNNNTIYEIWNGEKWRKIRECHIQGKIHLCNQCTEAEPLRWIEQKSEDILGRYD